MRRTQPTADDRGQAFTLEGFIGAIIVVTAVLLALQAVVITPSTGGAVDRTIQAQLQEEVRDSLIVAANEDDLTETVRAWEANESESVFINGTETFDRRGAYNTSEFTAESKLGAVLDTRFNESGRNYNVELVYENSSVEDRHEDPTNLVYQGAPSAGAVSASYTVTLFEDQHLTANGSENVTLEEAHEDHGYPIPNEGDGNVYNIVEVRVVVW